MDEEENYNNNNDKGAIDTIKNTAKKESKKVMKKGLKKVIKLALPYIGIFILCLLAVGLILATISSILNFFAGLLGVDADSLSGSEKATLTQAQKIISITKDGYEINDEYSEKILEDLKSQKVDIDEMKFLDIDSDMIDKYIRAELKTMYPKIGVGTEIDGLVTIQRMSAETGVATTLTYIYYDDFISKVEANDVSVLNNFSLNPNTFELCIANAETVILYDYDNGSRKEVSRTTTITAKEIEYQTTIQRYATPLNYFISMHMICEDKSFMNDLVKMVDQKTDIVLTFLESTYKEFLQVDYNGEITTYYYENKPITSQTPNPDYPGDPHAPAYIEEVIGYSHSLTGTETNTVDTGNISEYSQYITPKQYLTEHVYNAGDLYVTKANTWRLQSLLNVEVNGMHRDDIQVDNITNHVVIDEYDTVVFDREYSGSYNEGYIDEITNEWIENYDISINETAGGYDLTDFMALVESYPRVKNNLETAPSLLFYLLEQNENTQELSAVMKYVLFCFTGNNYGVTELDLADFLSGTTHLVGSDYIVHTEMVDENLKITDVETLKAAFSGYSGSQKLVQHAQDFLDMQEQYKVNAVFAAAVSIVETSAGRAGNAVNGLNNWFNISGGDPWKSYSSAREGIHAFGDLIANSSHYFTQGKYTVSQIGHTYCPNTDDYPTQADEWIEDIIGFMTNMYRAAGIDANPTLNTSGIGKIQDLINWAESYVGASQYSHWGGGYKSSTGTCAAFVKSAYYFNGFGQLYGVCGTAMGPIGERGNIVKTADGKVDCSQIPVGAFLVVPPGADGSNASYGHTALYVGNGCVIEAGASTVQKNTINVDAFSDGGYSYWVIPQGMKDYINSSEYRELLQSQ